MPNPTQIKIYNKQGHLSPPTWYTRDKAPSLDTHLDNYTRDHLPKGRQYTLYCIMVNYDQYKANMLTFTPM